MRALYGRGVFLRTSAVSVVFAPTPPDSCVNTCATFVVTIDMAVISFYAEQRRSTHEPRRNGYK